MRECGCYSTTTLVQPRRPCRPRHPYAVPRTLFQCVCTRRRNCIGQLSPFWEYAPAARQINPNASAPDSQSSLHSGGDRAEAVLELSRGRGRRRLEGRSRTKRPRLAGCKGRGRWRRVCSMRTLGAIPAAIVTGMDRISCPITQIFRYRLTKRHRAGAPSPTTIPPSHVAARSKRARRNVALHFWPQRHVLSTQWNFLSAGRAFDRDQRMLELWNNWYETLASMEALATVIVIVVVAAGVITLAESRRR
jgi:hypothetical protein